MLQATASVSYRTVGRHAALLDKQINAEGHPGKRQKIKFEWESSDLKNVDKELNLYRYRLHQVGELKLRSLMAVAEVFKNVVLTGLPGVGKTTLVCAVCKKLQAAGAVVWGFYTEEVRQSGRRVGFDIVTLTGERATLARVDAPRGPKVGQYTVTLQAFEMIALKVLRERPQNCILLIDEVGKMELFSDSFVQMVKKCLSDKSIRLITTIPVRKGKPIPLVEDIRHNPNMQLYEVTKDNRDSLVEVISNFLLPA